MPTEDDRNAGNEEQHEPAAPAAPTFSLGDVESIVDRAVGAALERTRPKAEPARPAPRQLPPAPTAEDYANDPAEATQRALARAMAPIEDRVQEFTSFGLQKLGDIISDKAGETLPYFKIYEKEIRAELAKVDPVFRTNPDTIKLCHDTVAMRHEGERLTTARNEAIRQQQQDAPAPGSANGRTYGLEPGVPTPEELGLSDENIEDIKQRGGPDAFAQRMSGGRFKNWADWVAARQRMNEVPKTTKGRVITFARLTDKKKSA